MAPVVEVRAKAVASMAVGRATGGDGDGGGGATSDEVIGGGGEGEGGGGALFGTGPASWQRATKTRQNAAIALLDRQRAVVPSVNAGRRDGRFHNGTDGFFLHLRGGVRPEAPW